MSLHNGSSRMAHNLDRFSFDTTFEDIAGEAARLDVGTDTVRMYLDWYGDQPVTVVGKAGMKYALIHVSYRRELKFDIPTTPLDRFESGVAYLQRRIRNTKLGRNLAKKGNPLYDSFEEFVAGRQGPGHRRSA